MASQDSSKWKLHTSGAMETIGRIWIQGGSEAGSDTNRLTTTSGMPGNMQYNQSRRGTQIYANGIAFADPYNGNSNSDAGWIRHLETTGNSGTLEIAVGDDGNEIIAARQYKTDNTINREVTLLDASGNTTVPGNFYFAGDGIYHKGTAANQRIIRIIDSGDQYGTGVSIGAGGLAILGSGESANTLISSLSLTAGGTETTYISSDGSIEFFPGQNSYDASSHISMVNGSIWAGIAGNTTRENQVGVRSGAGAIYMYAQASATGSRGIYLLAHGTGSAKGIVTVDTNNNATFTGGLSGNASTATRINGNLGAVSDANGHNIWVSSGTGADGIPKYVAGCYITASTGTLVCTSVKNAVWNDYAECRHSNELEPGRCVRETSTVLGMVRTTQRLMPGCKFVSDTYGALMGETSDAKTPIAVSGRVLAYPYRAREEYPLGAAVCSAPNGTIDIMTREEIMMYPERIVGTVSEIPDYEIWHGGSQDGKNDIQVNGRIWIYVK